MSPIDILMIKSIAIKSYTSYSKVKFYKLFKLVKLNSIKLQNQNQKYKALYMSQRQNGNWVTL